MIKVRKAMLLLAVIPLLVAGYLLCCAHTESYCYVYPGIDTRYAPGYSDEAFNQVSVGMPAEAVEQLLGKPLYVQHYAENHEKGELWFYTLDGKCKWGDWAWLCRQVDFRNRKVVEAIKRIAYD